MPATKIAPSPGIHAAIGRQPVASATRAGRIVNLTASPRLGVRGPGVPNWCAEHAVPFPDKINTTLAGNGLTVARLGRNEILVLPEKDHPLPAAPFPPGVRDGYRDEGWCWLRLEGGDCRASLSRMTSVDLRPVKALVGAVLQTRLAGLDAVLVIRRENEEFFEIFSDIASMDHLLEVIFDSCPELRIILGA